MSGEPKIVRLSYIGLEKPKEAFMKIKKRLATEGIQKNSYIRDKRRFGETNADAMKRVMDDMVNPNSKNRNKLVCYELDGVDKEEAILIAKAPPKSKVYIFLGLEGM